MTDKPKDVLQPVDAAALKHAMTLMRTARFASLGTLDAALGAPSVSRVAVASFPTGEMGFFISALAAHHTNLLADGRCSLLVGEPGKGDPLAYPRMTVIGSAARLGDGSEKDNFRYRFRSKNAKSKLYQDLPDFSYWKVAPIKASLNAGFGKAYALSATDLTLTITGIEDWRQIEPGVVEHMNADHAAAVDKYAAIAGSRGEGWRLACLDPEGLDLVNGDETARLWFDPPLQFTAEIRPRLIALARS